MWVAPDGRCVNGHGPEFLTAYYESVPAEKPAGSLAEPAAGAHALPLAPPPAVAQTPAAVLPQPLTRDLTHHMWRRLLAFLIDYGIASVIGLVFAFSAGVVWALVTHLHATPALKVFSQVGVLVILYAYFIVSEGLSSTTLGKRLFGLKVRSARTGSAITWKQSVMRNVSLVVDLLFFGLVGVLTANGSAWRQRFGDRAANTVVLKSDARESTLGDPAELTGLSMDLVPMRAVVPLVLLGLLIVGTTVWYTQARSTPVRTAPAVTPASASGTNGRAAASAGAPAIDRTSITSDLTNPPQELADIDTAPSDNRAPKLTTDPGIPAPALDAFIARQYPGYRVQKRVSFPDQYDQGRLGVNYLLVNEKVPGFRLLVSVAQLKQSEDLYNTDTNYSFQVGRILTTDGTFSVQAKKDYAELQQQGQDAIIRAVVKKKPSPDALVYGTYRESMIEFEVESGKGALERAMQDNDFNSVQTIKVSPPLGKKNAQVNTVELVTNN